MDNEFTYANADPPIPEQLFNRVEDNWRPRLALADVIGGEWPTRLREIAVKIAKLESGEDPSTDTQLLRDLHEIVADRDWITSKDLLGGLNGREYMLSGKRLVNVLKPYGIEPRQERRGSKIERGYLVRDFADAFARYLDVPDVPDAGASSEDAVERGLATGTNGTNGTR
jgi:putative DNA primase/helicase